MQRRQFLTGATAIGALAVGGLWWQTSKSTVAMAAKGEKAAEVFEVSFTDAQWKDRLSGPAYKVLRHEGTEGPFTSALNDEHRPGEFTCAGCDLALYDSKTKFESGTGWPSFYEPLTNAVGLSEDNTLFAARVEVHCRRCGGHLGHVFGDGPAPTGKRYCMNGVAMGFTPISA